MVETTMKTKCKQCEDKDRKIAALVAILRTILKRYRIEASDYYTAEAAIGEAEKERKI